MTTSGKCAALDPATCRYHGLILKMNQALRDEDADAYLYYAERVATREQLTDPEEFFVPEHEAEDIASVKQLHDLFRNTTTEQLPRVYRAEVTYDSITRGRYRRHAKKNKLQFEETRQHYGSDFVFHLKTRHDVVVLSDMIAHGQDLLNDREEQAAGVARQAAAS